MEGFFSPLERSGNAPPCPIERLSYLKKALESRMTTIANFLDNNYTLPKDDCGYIAEFRFDGIVQFQGCVPDLFKKYPETNMKLYPSARKVFLHLTAGIMWSGVGIMLVVLASHWLILGVLYKTILLILAGLALAAAIYYFGFSKMALKNIHRIEAYPQKRVCLFAFQKWSSYPLILFMVGLGIYLRLYSPIPKSILAILYIGLGVSLFLSSIHYYSRIFQRLTHVSDSK